MVRRIITAREQHAMLSPWRVAMPAEDAYDSDRTDRSPQPINATGPWYHGSSHDIPEGTILTPGEAKDKTTRDSIYTKPGWDSRQNWIWMHNDPYEAHLYPNIPGDYLYELEPLDEGPHAWNGDEGEKSWGYVSPRARVVRKIDPGDWRKTYDDYYNRNWQSKPGMTYMGEDMRLPYWWTKQKEERAQKRLMKQRQRRSSRNDRTSRHQTAATADDDMSEAGRAWARSVGGDRIGAVFRIAKHQPFDLLDDYYFPGYTYGAGEPDEHNPDLLDLQNAWLIGEGLQRRQPHMERGVVHGPAHPDAALTDTERHLQNMGHEFTRRIHQSPGSEYPLYRGMVVPPDFIDRHSTGSTLRLPLSSFDGDPSLAWDYSTPVPEHHSHHAGKDGVLLHLPQGTKALHLVDAEHVTHGDYDVIRAHRATDQNRADLCGYGDQDAPCDCNAAPSTSDSHRPMILHLRQRSVPAPVGTHTASRRAFLEHIAQQI